MLKRLWHTTKWIKKKSSFSFANLFPTHTSWKSGGCCLNGFGKHCGSCNTWILLWKSRAAIGFAQRSVPNNGTRSPIAKGHPFLIPPYKCKKKKLYPDAPCREYLPTLGEKWPHSRGNVGKYSIHGAFGIESLRISFKETHPAHALAPEKKKKHNFGTFLFFFPEGSGKSFVSMYVCEKLRWNPKKWSSNDIPFHFSVMLQNIHFFV